MARARQSRAGTRTRRRRVSAESAAGEPAILAWEDDPGEPTALRSPIGRPAPNLAPGSLPVAIEGAAPEIGRYPPGTPEFRYWTAADALARAAEFWDGLLGGTTWHPDNGATLPVELDEGVQFNA